MKYVYNRVKRGHPAVKECCDWNERFYQINLLRSEPDPVFLPPDDGMHGSGQWQKRRRHKKNTGLSKEQLRREADGPEDRNDVRRNGSGCSSI